MRTTYTARFRKAYKRLKDKASQRQVKDAIKRMEKSIKHPSLNLEKVEGAKGPSSDIWSVRASRSVRITFEMDGDPVILRNVGKHDETLGNP